MKGSLRGVGAAVARQPAPPGTGASNPGRNSFAPRPGRNPSAPSLGPAGGYALRIRGAGDRWPGRVKWLVALVAIEIVGGEMVHRAFRNYYGS